ncbi:MAG: nitroreductase, partial [Acidimicrobiia bacterium]|nr:nitroreductase [Acidimicrobiia bacterium]
MNVSEAVDRRSTIRAFLDTPVPTETILTLLEKAARAPSGGNVQPWVVYVVNGGALDRFKALVAESPLDEPEYEVYPPNLWDPHRTARFELGEQMYALLGIAREDRKGRLANLARNYTFFGAPATIFCFVDRRMGPPQWSDLGMFLQTFMLLATESGIDTCPQEAWASRGRTVARFVGAPDELLLFSGVALGYRDPAAPVN